MIFHLAITRRKIELRDDEVVRAINSLDLKTLNLDRVEILQRIVPNEQVSCYDMCCIVYAFRLIVPNSCLHADLMFTGIESLQRI